jgi:hypothetical protein
MLDRMGVFISDALVWSLATNPAKSYGLHIVLTEYQRLIGIHVCIYIHINIIIFIHTCIAFQGRGLIFKIKL